MPLRIAVVLLGLFLLGPAASPAGAFLFQEKGGPQSAGNGIALGPDGNFWVAEEFSGTVVRLTPAGTVVDRFDIAPREPGAFDNGASPTSVANGPGGRVWVAATGAGKLVWFDATSPEPTQHDVPIGFGCGPVGLAAGGDGRMYFSLPSCGEVGSVAGDGTGQPTRSFGGGGAVFDLEAVGAKLFAPDFDGGVVRRLSLGTLAVETEVSIPTPEAGPDGVTADRAGNIWVTEWNSGKVAAFPAAQEGGEAIELTPSGGTLANPFGIVQGADGRMYVAGKSSANIARVSGDGSFAFYPLDDSEPLNIINGTDGDLWFTDQKKTRIVRLVNDRPRADTRKARSTGPTSARAGAAVNPRGNATEVVFEYGPTKKLGKRTKAVSVPNGADPARVVGVLTKLKSETRYFVRARASNAEGTTRGARTRFKTPPFPELSTSTSIRVVVRGSAVVVDSIAITRLRGTETATIRCRGSSCPFSVKRVKLKKGSQTFGSGLLGGRALAPGTTLSVRVTAPRTIGTSTVLQVRAGKSPRIKRACVRPKAKRPSRCP